MHIYQRGRGNDGDSHLEIADRQDGIDGGGRGNLQDDLNTTAPQFPGQAPNNTGLGNTKGIATGLTSALSPTMINNFRYGLTRVGLENSGVSLNEFVTFRTIDLLNGNTRPFIRLTPTHTLADDFNWTKGSHDLKFGFVTRMIRNRRLNYANSVSAASTNSSWLVNSGAELNTPLGSDIRSTAIVAYRDAAMAVLGVVSQGTAAYNYNNDGTAMPRGRMIPLSIATDYKNPRAIARGFFVWRRRLGT